MTVLQIPTERASALLAHHRQQMLALDEDSRELMRKLAAAQLGFH